MSLLRKDVRDVEPGAREALLHGVRVDKRRMANIADFHVARCLLCPLLREEGMKTSIARASIKPCSGVPSGPSLVSRTREHQGRPEGGHNQKAIKNGKDIVCMKTHLGHLSKPRIGGRHPVVSRLKALSGAYAVG